MDIDLDWFHGHIKEIVLVLSGILLVIIIEHWVNGTNHFFYVINPLIRSLFEALLIILIILLIAMYWHSD